MTVPKVPSYLAEVTPADWAFALLERTRQGQIAIPPHPRHRNKNLPVIVVYDDSDLWE